MKLLSNEALAEGDANSDHWAILDAIIQQSVLDPLEQVPHLVMYTEYI